MNLEKNTEKHVLFQQHSELKYKYYRLTSVAILALSDIAFSIAHYYVASENFSPIGWGAHFAGAISGLLIGLLIFKGNFGLKKIQYKIFNQDYQYIFLF